MEMMKKEHDKKVADGLAPSHVLVLGKEMWDAWTATKDEWAATVQRERDQQEDMAAIEENLGLVTDAPQVPDQLPPPLNNPPNPIPQVPNRQPAAVRHADENGNHVRVIPENALHTRYHPLPTNRHNNTRQQHRSSVTPQSAARPRANATIRANSRLTFDLTDDDDSDAGDLITQRPALHQRH